MRELRCALRALEERNALDAVNRHIAVGWLVVEDLVMVLALVLLGDSFLRKSARVKAN
jgi:predicted Kef-type K+ transport protein